MEINFNKDKSQKQDSPGPFLCILLQEHILLSFPS